MAIRDAGLNPTDWDAVLWEAFHPQGLAGFKQNYYSGTSSSTNAGQSFEDKINALIGG